MSIPSLALSFNIFLADNSRQRKSRTNLKDCNCGGCYCCCRRRRNKVTVVAPTTRQVAMDAGTSKYVGGLCSVSGVLGTVIYESTAPLYSYLHLIYCAFCRRAIVSVDRLRSRVSSRRRGATFLCALMFDVNRVLVKPLMMPKFLKRVTLVNTV